MTTTTENYLTRSQIIDICTERDGYFCYLCAEDFDDTIRGRELTIDHVQPLSKGGTWDIGNLALACRKCNQEKADREFLPDGTLEPRAEREGYQQRRANRERILEQFCDLCENGRLLVPEEYCPTCFRGAKPFPTTMRRQPKDCSHSGYEWCWMDACGLIDRVPAWEYVLDAGTLDD